MVINNRDDVKTVRDDYKITRDHKKLLTVHQDKDYRIVLCFPSVSNFYFTSQYHQFPLSHAAAVAAATATAAAAAAAASVAAAVATAALKT
jgi:hypothetical protein